MAQITAASSAEAFSYIRFIFSLFLDTFFITELNIFSSRPSYNYAFIFHSPVREKCFNVASRGIICFWDDNECDGIPQSGANSSINIRQFNSSLSLFYSIDEQLSVSRNIILDAYIMEASRLPGS